MNSDSPFILQANESNILLVVPPLLSEDETRIKYNQNKTLLMIFLNILGLGIPYLVGRWYPQLSVQMYYSPVYSLAEATHCLVTGVDNNIEIIQINKENGEKIMIQYRYFRYQYKVESNRFESIESNYSVYTCEQIQELMTKGVYSKQQQQEIEQQFGKNIISIDIKSSFRIFIDEVLTPFYIFQVFSFIIWYLGNYVLFTTVLLLMSIYGIILTVIQTRSNLLSLQQMAQYQSNIYEISTVELVPGDIIQIKDNCVIPCDAILISGECIINEAMLTGESIPIIKSALPDSTMKYDFEEHKQHTLFCGTQCLQTKNGTEGNNFPLALVTQTGFNTEKGRLIRQILFPKRTQFKFNTDSYIFIGGMSIVALIVFTWSFISQIQQGIRGYWLIIRSLTVITIAVPPSLPACMSSVLAASLERLKQQNIFCISPQRVNVCGTIDIMCFDKTGTLTENGLDIYGIKTVLVDPINQKIQFHEFIKHIQSLNVNNNNNKIQREIYQILQTCHSIAEINNTLIGDPLDVKMFESTGSVLIENTKGNISIIKCYLIDEELQIIRRFEFSATLQRMSVITLNEYTNQYTLNVKGSPEKIIELCVPESIPNDFQQTLKKYTKKGYRVLALANKQLNNDIDSILTLKRENLEEKLRFRGLLVMENKLKIVTQGIIQQLQDSDIKCVMITGDNILTAINVAKNCSLISQQENVYIPELDIEDKQITWTELEYVDPNDLSPVKRRKSFSHIPINNNNDEYYNRVLRRSVTPTNMNSQRKIPLSFEISLGNSIISKQLSNNNSKIVFRQEQDNMDLKLPLVYNQEYVLAITGRVFTYINNKVKEENNPQGKYYEYMTKILQKGRVYARMQPEEKAALINSLKERGLITGMCGDGANDCAALRAADMGISLSDTEASIAAPFTSKQQDIQCIIKLLSEGRASLTTSFQIFKFIVFYSLIQCYIVALLYYRITDMTDYQYIYNDLILSFFLSLTICRTKPHHQLSIDKPSVSLLSVPVLSSIIGQLVMQFIFASIIMVWVIQQPFYQSKDSKESLHNIQGGYENTALFYVCNFQLIAASLAFNVGKPLREEIYQNSSFLISLIILSTYNISLVLFPDSFSFELFKLVVLPTEFRFMLFSVLLINFLLMLAYDHILLNKLFRFSQPNNQQKNQLEIVSVK